VRVALATGQRTVSISATGGWRLYERDGKSVLVRGGGGDVWRIERRGERLRAVRPDGSTTASGSGPFVARPVEAGALLTWNGRRYRGELRVASTERGLIVVNRLPVESYLRGVVPSEIGDRAPGEIEAVAAQAVAARSYTYVRLGGEPRGLYDVVASTTDQVYGGVEVEKPVADAAIEKTVGEVLLYAGRVVNAPYHSTCGGSTAEANEVWRTPGEPFLQRVSDQVPGSDRYYCEPSPRFRWTETFDGQGLDAVLERYLRSYAAVPRGGVGEPRMIAVETRTPSGRVGTLAIETDRGRFLLNGNDIRYVLRRPGGEILNSTYFSVEPTIGRDGHITSLTIVGTGYGHGVGMCQWGAIGRAREGQDYRTILQTYYPGTTVGTPE
jgi:stage II sporulation protein D (peptidoglycan lytic transglycosylase)